MVMPVYNEAGCITQVVEDWVSTFRELAPDFIFCLVNDGCTDETPKILDELAGRHPELALINKENTGHGQSCVTGYKAALDSGASWVFQIDSDGQCDSAFFKTFWEQRHQHRVLYGFRKQREDGFSRWLISRVLSLVIFINTRCWLVDANVPYRLMHRDSLDVVNRIPRWFYLSNCLLSVFQQQATGIHWIPIRFKKRLAGKPSFVNLSFARQGLNLIKDFHRLGTDGINGEC